MGRSIIDSEFHCTIDATTRVGGRAAIVPSTTGRAWITGMHQHMLDPDDPRSEGYRPSDTWPAIAPRRCWRAAVSQRRKRLQDRPQSGS